MTMTTTSPSPNFQLAPLARAISAGKDFQLGPTQKPLAGAVVSDIHLGHRRNGTRGIVINLRDAFPDNAQTGELDIIWLAGDVFDDLLQLSDEDLADIDFWIADFLRICKKWNISVRVLEGTPSHDWKQSQRFVTMNEAAQIGADLKYVTTLSIEYIEHLGINVLYVPDEWELTTEKTLGQVHELLRAKGLDKVDYAIMHGQFAHQLPDHVKAQSHDSEAYLSIVKELIFIGHVHTYSRYKRILAQGSFDRLAHGEEAPKGHLRFFKQTNGDMQVQFHENFNAMRFITIKCLGMDLEQTLEEVDKVVLTLPDESFVRVESESTNPIFANMDLLIRNYPFIQFSKLSREDAESEKALIEDQTLFVPITITRDNIVPLLMERLASNGATDALFSRSERILQRIIQQ
jgi:hypothetical protein